jgi:hypothetical protein
MRGETEPGAVAGSNGSTTDPNRHDRFFLRQRIRPMVNQYEVSTLGDD